MNALYENEKKKKDVGHSRLVSFIRPAHQIPYPPQEGPEQRPFTSYLEPHPTLPLSYFLDATFNPIIEAQVTSGSECCSWARLADCPHLALDLVFTGGE